MVSLEQLIEAGLYDLYLEFNDAASREEWPKRVRHLRQDWLTEQGTTDREIELALRVGRECFGHFELCDISSVILTLKYRKMSKPERSSE